MVKQLHMEMDDEVFDNTHPGCIWGIFHTLNYNYWQKNVKKILPHRKHYQPKYSKGTGRARTRLIACDSDEVEELLDVQANRLPPVSSKTRKTSSTNKKSLRTRIKSLISEDSPKKESYEQRQSRLQRTYSIHHLECSDYVLSKITKNVDKVRDVKNQEFYEKFKRSGRDHVSGKHVAEEEDMDVLEIYRVNKDLFAKILKHSDGGIARSFCDLENSETGANLSRSGSYPSPKLSKIKSIKSTKLDHKKNEIWSHSKIDKLFPNSKSQTVEDAMKFSRRTLSLNESSLERYSQLLSKSSIGEPRLSSSTSLKLTNDCSFRRVRSLSRGDFYGIFENEPSSDGHSAVLVAKGNLDSNRNNENDSSNEAVEDLYNSVDSMNEEDTNEVPKISEEIEEKVLALEDPEKEEETEFVEFIEEKLPISGSTLMVESDLEEDLTSPTDFLASEDLNCGNLSLDKESSFDTHIECSSKSVSNKIELHTRCYSDFDFVSDILDRSSFSGNDLLASWFSVDQPLDPSVYDDVEASWPHEDSYPKDDFCCHHQLLFDLMNEALVQICDTSFTYYPRALSSICKVPPVSKKFNLLDEVWGKVSKIMNIKLVYNQTVESIVAQDIWNDERWMNLQLESECVAIELEDMLFDELLEEISC